MKMTSAGRLLLEVVGTAIALTIAFHALYPWTAIGAPVEAVLVCVALLAALAGEAVWSLLARRSNRMPVPRPPEPPPKERDA
jgi:hypothetical protein